jgi:hypothetical protein
MRPILRSTAAPAPGLARRAWESWSAFFFRPADALPLGVVRIGVGALLVWNLLVLGLDLHDFLGSDGWIGPEANAHYLAEHTPGAWSIWFWVPDRWLWPAWAACLAFAAAFTLGFCARATALASWIVIVSLARRMPVALFGFDLTLSNWIFYLAAFGASGHALSVDRWIAARRRRAAGASTRPERRDGADRDDAWSSTTVGANLSLRMIQLHLALVYGCAGLSKLSGPEWLDGTALEMLVLTPEFRRFDLAWTLRYPTILMLSTYAGVLLDLAYPILIWIKRWRRLVIANVVLMHVLIDLMLGLREFGLAMIVANLAFLPVERRARSVVEADGPTAIRSAASPAGKLRRMRELVAKRVHQFGALRLAPQAGGIPE